jgi:hypothetical protein
MRAGFDMHRNNISAGLSESFKIGIFLVCGRMARTMSGPMEILGTKWPSMTSTWIQSAPAASTARTSSPSFAKSAAKIEGAMMSGRANG